MKEKNSVIITFEPQALIDPHTPNFKQHEIMDSDTARREDIDNTPSLEILNNAVGVALHCMQPIRNKFGPVTVNSWYRCEELERIQTKKGFADWCIKRGLKQDEAAWALYFPNKQHPKGNAVDFEIIGISNDEVFEWCKANLQFDQLIREYAKPGIPDSGWVHISWVPEGNRNQVLHIG